MEVIILVIAALVVVFFAGYISGWFDRSMSYRLDQRHKNKTNKEKKE